MHHQFGRWRLSGRRIGVGAIVVKAQGCEMRKKRDEIEPAVVVAPADIRLRNVVAAHAHSRSHAFDMKLGTGKPRVPDINLDALRCGSCEQPRNRISPEGSLEGKIEAFHDSPFKKPHALAPGRAVGGGLSQGMVGGHQSASSFVGVVVVASEVTKGCAANAALARAVNACENVNAWRP